MNDEERHEQGMTVRRAVLGDAWREGALDLHESVFEETLHQFIVHGV